MKDADTTLPEFVSALTGLSEEEVRERLSPYRTAEDVEKEIRIWWERRHDRTSKRWHPAYVRKIIRAELDRLRYLRTSETRVSA